MFFSSPWLVGLKALLLVNISHTFLPVSDWLFTLATLANLYFCRLTWNLCRFVERTIFYIFDTFCHKSNNNKIVLMNLYWKCMQEYKEAMYGGSKPLPPPHTPSPLSVFLSLSLQHPLPPTLGWMQICKCKFGRPAKDQFCIFEFLHYFWDGFTF